MPNWCMNELFATGLTPQETKDFKEKYISLSEPGTYPNGTAMPLYPYIDFNKVKPMPARLHETVSPSGDDPETQAQLIREYGAVDWYNWKVQNWGTKWQPDPENMTVKIDPTEIYAYYESAWAPTTKLIERLSEIYPNAEFKLQYAEPSMDFAGMVKWKNGVVIHSDEDPTGEIMKEMVGGEPEEDEE